MENPLVLDSEILSDCSGTVSMRNTDNALYDCSSANPMRSLTEIKYGEIIKEYYYYTGFTGPTGPEGPTGPTCSCNTISNTFINTYSTSSQQVLKNYPVIFDTNSSISGICYHSPGTPQIYLYQTGFYYVYINLYHIEGSQFSLFKNSIHIVPQSTIGSVSGSSQNSTCFILEITQDDLTLQISNTSDVLSCQIELINITQYTPSITLYDASSLGYDIPQINASITLFLLCG